MLKRILVPLDSTPFTEAALSWACSAAKTHDAEVTGMVVLDIPGIEKSVGPVPLGGFYYAEQLEKTRARKAQEHIDMLLHRFDKTCSERGVRHRAMEHQGSPHEEIIRESLFYDALVMGLRSCFCFGEEERDWDPLDQLMDHSVTPVYGIPERPVIPDLSREKMGVVVAFDGSLPAARALQRFGQFAVPGHTKVTLLSSEDDRERGRFLLDRAAQYLAARGITEVEQEVTSQGIKDSIEERFMGPEVHLIVVGAHSKKGLLDFMVGSLSRHLIQAAKKPLLIG